MDTIINDLHEVAVELQPMSEVETLFLKRVHHLLPVVLYCSTYRNDRWIIRYVSQQVQSLLGYAPEELVHRRSWKEITKNPDSLYDSIPKASDTNKRFHMTVKMRGAEGVFKTFSDDGVFLYDNNGRLSGSVGVFVDITAQKQAEEALALNYQRLSNLLKRPASLFGIVGNSEVMQDAFSRIIKLAASSANVVITGESGTGKELAARAIHELSNRSDKPFVAVNCGAISDQLFESEFFGHVKGAFTGASSERKGYLEQADGGTIFLDEIGEIAPFLQVKLLRALDGYGYLPVGGNKTKTSNFRMIAATNRNLESMVRDGTMRKDFFFRIKTFNLTMPPLRERIGDIPLLASYFLKKISGAKYMNLSLDDLERLNNYDWPGNVRELQNAIYRFAAFQDLGIEVEAASGESEAQSARAALEPFQPEIRNSRPSPPQAPEPRAASAASSAVETFSPEYLVKALNANFWNVSRTARQLGLGRATVYRRINQWGLRRPGWAED